MSSMEGDVKSIGSSGVRGVDATLSNRGISEQIFNFNNDEWKLITTKSTMLPSHCYCSTMKKKTNESQIVTKDDNDEVDSNATAAVPSSSSNPNSETTVSGPDICQVCRFSAGLSLTHYPEMVFPDNVLRLVHTSTGFVIEFNALDAMKLIDVTTSPVQVACSEHWKASRIYTGLPETVIEPFDWTFSTEYQGSFKTGNGSNSLQIEMEPSQQLDLEKLKQPEKILFYEALTLYEDELHDNGVSTLSVKIRVMPSGFFILLRFFLRVDSVLIKLHDTRIYFEIGNNYFLRQFQTREQSFDQLDHLEGNILGDPNLVYPHLRVTNEINEKVELT